MCFTLENKYKLGRTLQTQGQSWPVSRTDGYLSFHWTASFSQAVEIKRGICLIVCPGSGGIPLSAESHTANQPTFSAWVFTLKMKIGSFLDKQKWLVPLTFCHTVSQKRLVQDNRWQTVSQQVLSKVIAVTL